MIEGVEDSRWLVHFNLPIHPWMQKFKLEDEYFLKYRYLKKLSLLHLPFSKCNGTLTGNKNTLGIDSIQLTRNYSGLHVNKSLP
jgi:hypothetical protein